VYYLPVYRQKAVLENKNCWPCKIGKTDRDPLQRVLNQASTALPENPHIALILKTDNAADLENVIHGVLAMWGKKIDTSPGSEWFLTYPEEVELIYHFIYNYPENS
jgi:hypothetical protein